MLKLLRYVATLPVLLACVGMFALMLLTFLDVLLRSLFNSPLEAATELIRLLMAVVVFSALPVISASDAHINVDLMDRFFSPLLARLRDAVIALACGAMLVLPAQRCIVLAERARSYGDVTEYLNIPLFYMAWFISVMTWLTAMVLIVRGLILLFKPSLLEPSGSGANQPRVNATDVGQSLQ